MMESMPQNARVYVAGHEGMVGSAIMRQLKSAGFCNIITAPLRDLDLRNEAVVREWFNVNRPEYVLLAAARVGGIQANRTRPAEFFYDNIMIQSNVFHSSYLFGVKRLLFLGSSCVYPRLCPQPIKEEYLMTGPLEPTNEAYALAKIAGLKMAQYYDEQYGFRIICPMPCNLYGPNDNYDRQESHVLPGLIRRFVEAVDEGRDEVVLWGSGKARREFMHVDDLARAILFLMDTFDSSEVINVGSGEEIAISDLAALVADGVGFRGTIVWDQSKPDGMPRRVLNVDRIKSIGFQTSIPLKDGIDMAIAEFRLRQRSGTLDRK